MWRHRCTAAVRISPYAPRSFPARAKISSLSTPSAAAQYPLANAAKRSKWWPTILTFSAAAAPFALLGYMRPPGGALVGLDRTKQTLYTDFSDTEKVFAPVKTRELAKTLLIYRICSHAWLVDNAETVIKWLPKLSAFVLKYTVYGHFVAGLDLEEALQAVREKYVPIGVSVSLFYSIENTHTKEEWDAVDEQLRTAMSQAKFAGKVAGGLREAVEFMPIKITGLTDDKLLLLLASWLRFQRRFPDHPAVKKVLGVFHPEPVGYDLASSYAAEAADTDGMHPPAEFTADQLQLLHDTVARLNSLVDFAVSLDLHVLVDAEQTFLQPAIDFLAVQMMRHANGRLQEGEKGAGEESKTGTDKMVPAGREAVVFNTYQNYLTCTADKLKWHTEMAEKEGWTLGAKLVRGAYLEGERALARRENLPNPIYPLKMATDRAYNAAVSNTLDHVTNGSAALYVATHNLESIVLAAQKSRQMGLEPSDKSLYFAQLMGMGWNLTLALAQMGFNVNKLVPYGPVEKVLPYLLRRLQENKDVMAGAQYERQLMYTELKRRAGIFSALFL